MLAPTQDDCFANLHQEFLICTTIHKARHLGNFTGEIYVRVSMEKVRKSTKSFTNSENPFFNEYFVFELKCTLSELLRLTILYEVKKHTSCKKDGTIGELLIDMQSVWNQPNRCFFKKWGRLESPIGSIHANDTEQGKGYLQIDLAIVSQATNTNMLLRPYEGEMLAMNKWQINQDYDDIEKNLLQNIDTGIQCNIRYSVTFYRGYFTKKSDYLLQGKTIVCKSTTMPQWNQEVSFAWTYPSLAHTFLIQVLMHEHMQWKCIADYELHFDEIAFKDKPSLGPTFLHLYDSVNGNNYLGRLLVEVHSECLKENKTRNLASVAVHSIDEKRWWQDETFLIEFLALQGDFIHGNFSNCKMTLKLAEHTSNQVECFLKTYPTKNRTTRASIKYFKQEPPFKGIYLKAVLPDNRHKFESDYFMQEILEYMKTEIETFKLFQLKYTNQFQIHIKILKAIIMNIQGKIKQGKSSRRLEYTGFKDPTTWDTNRLVHIQEFFNKLPDSLRKMRERLKNARAHNIDYTIEDILQALFQHSIELTNLLASTRVQDDWPHLFIVLSVSGNKDIAICRLNAKYFLNPPKEKEISPTALCWRLRNFIFKDINCPHTCMNCGCIAGVIRGCLSIVLENERNNYLSTMAHDWTQTEPFYWNPTIPLTHYKCRVFIHQAKVRPGSDRSGLCDAHVRVVLGSKSAETYTEPATLSPIWNAVISFEGISMPGSIQFYVHNPPLLAVELYDTDKLTADDYLGCGTLTVSVVNNEKALENADDGGDAEQNVKLLKTKNALQKFQQLKTLTPPTLKWVAIALNGSVRAEVLMSAELMEIQGDVQKNDVEATIASGIPYSIKPNMKNFVLEVVFVGFRDYTKSTFGGRHRIKIMMGDLLLMSGLSSTRIKNSMNFLVLHASGVVSLPEQLEYWPAIIATDVVVSGRGSESTVGAVLIANSKRFLFKNRKIKCIASGPNDPDQSITSTTVVLEEIDDAETRPLLAKNNRTNVLRRFFDSFKSKKKSNEDSKQVSKMVKAHKNMIVDTEFTWWTKFYNSMYSNSVKDSFNYKHTLTIYPHELEKQSDLSYLHDWAEPVKLVHGVKYKKNTIPKEEVYATLKLNIKIMPCQCNGGGDDGDGAMLRPLAAALNPRYQAQLQALTELCKIVARIYIVQGIQFRPHDKFSQSDSYVKLTLGSKTTFNRAHYVPNQSNPIFGKCFQLDGLLPRDHMLEISIFDRNAMRDEIIGTTVIDLEDRWRTRHRATIGIANEYSKTGYNKWRDISTPSEILMDLCMNRDINPPNLHSNTIEVDGVVFTDDTKLATDEDLQERLSLTALKNFEMLPSFGYKLMPEHVETRSLYRKDCPGIEQGKIQLWIELYEGNVNIPPAIDITPQPPQIYELRVIIYNCADVLLDERNIFGKRMSDIFVKGWCHDATEAQSTDIHYRSLNGEANFNWRMVFPLKYSLIEEMMVVKRKTGLLDEYETKQPPILYLQIWDNDMISKDDFLGALEINLANLPEPFSNRKSCKIPETTYSRFPFGSLGSGSGSSTVRKPINLFRAKTAKGWFPVRGQLRDKSSPNKIGMTGKIEMELIVMAEAEASAKPVGLGRNPPDALPEPVRPDTSFNPLTHPLKALRKILLPAMGKLLLLILFFAIVIFSVVSFFSDLPRELLGLG